MNKNEALRHCDDCLTAYFSFKRNMQGEKVALFW